MRAKTPRSRSHRWAVDDWNVTATWVKTYAAGRRCCLDGCKTILSRYNGGETCDLHKAAPDCSDFTDRLIFGEKRCPTCEESKPRNTEHYFRDDREPDCLRRVCRMCEYEPHRARLAANADKERIRYQTDPEFRERRKATSRENKARRYAADPEFRERVKASARASKARCKARGNV